MVKISIVVAVYNPGPYLAAPVDSFLRQTMPREEFEVILVDDGSTDGTGRRLDRLARKHPTFSVIHIPNSGWPGRPRNLGIDAARGRYVLFVDHDDWLEDDALDYLWRVAEENGADVVAAREVGHGFGVPRRMFRRTIPDAKLGRDDILALLTPHKLFRRQMLVEHGVRFPEGPRRLEDHDFVVRAYFAARRITVTGDHPVYHWAKRDAGENATGQAFDRRRYYENLRDVLDIVDANTEAGPMRDRLAAHWLRFKMIHKLLRPRFRKPGPDAHRLFGEVRELMAERFRPEADRFLPAGYRLVARAVRADRIDRVVAAATYANALRLEAKLRSLDTAATPMRAQVEWALRGPDGAPLRLVRRGGRLAWEAPADLVDGLDVDDSLDVEEEMGGTELSLVLRQRGTDLDHDRPVPIPIVETEGAAQLAGTATLELDPATFAAGSPLPDGTWDALLHVEFGGFRRQARLEAVDARIGPARDGIRPSATVDGTLALRVSHGVRPIRPPRVAGGIGRRALGARARAFARRILPPGVRRRLRGVIDRRRR